MSASKKTAVVIVDYGLCNLFSVKSACDYIGLEAVISSDSSDIMKADGLILPGVGAFGDAMNNIRKLDLILPLKEFADTGRPFLGICLGMQLLMSYSQEFGYHEGLNMINGGVVKFPDKNKDGEKLKIPQVGWNNIYKPVKENSDFWINSPLENLSDGVCMYFVHSFYVNPEDKHLILSQTNYQGFEFCSSLQNKNIFACQYHPEKSAADGLSVYKSWAKTLKK